MNEAKPVETAPNPAGTGAPVVADEQFQKWINAMHEWLRRGCTLWYAMDKADLLVHKTVIYKKYKSNDPNDVWFAEKIDKLRSTLGEMTNDLVFRVIENAKNRMIESPTAQMTDNEVKITKLVAERHRTAQPFFVNRTETAEADDSKVGKILDDLGETDYDELGSAAQKQMVATHPPVQNNGQAGQANNVQAKPSPAPTPVGTGQPPVQPSPQS